MAVSRCRTLAFCILFVELTFCAAGTRAEEIPDGKAGSPFRAGAAALEITPTVFPVIVSGGFTEQTATKALDRLHARAIVLDDGKTKLAIVVVDSCGIEARFLDEAKRLAHEATGIPTDRMLIAATHTHSAPSSWGVLGSRVDEKFTAGLIPQIARVIKLAAERLEPAQIGWTVVDAPKHTFNRRWILRSDKMQTDPFGVRSVRAMMHPGYQNPNYIGPSGPVDTELSLVGIRAAGGRPIAALANYSQHYFGSPAVSADYFGIFAARLAELIGESEKADAPVAMMSQGTSGDLMWMDYGGPRPTTTMKQYADELAAIAHAAWKKIEFRTAAPLKMAEQKLKFRRRVPDEARLAWAKPIVAAMKDRQPRTPQEVYAAEAEFLHAEPEVELKLQAVAIGDLSIAAIPNEVFALTGLKLKCGSPSPHHFTMELANGSFGYIPPPEQHKLGGYTTWPARSAGLEEQAEPKIVQTVQQMLWKSQGINSWVTVFPECAYGVAVSASKPVAYWPLGDLDPTTVLDLVPHDKNSPTCAAYEPGVAFLIDGPAGLGMAQPTPSFHLPRMGKQSVFASSKESAPRVSRSFGSRAAHFAGGRVRSELPQLGQRYSIEFWFWNGFPSDVRPVTGYFCSRGTDGDATASGDHWGISGTIRPGNSGRLFFFNGNSAGETVFGHTPLALKTWQHVVLVRDGETVRAYLNGKKEPELAGRARFTLPEKTATLFIGGRCDNFANFEGKMAHVAIYDRVLTPMDVEAHYTAAVGAKEAAEERNDETTPVKDSVGSRTPMAGGPPAATAVPLTPAEGVAAWQVSPGFRIELVAAEPLVMDPVAIDWGADGKLWVAEMADYPLGLDGKGKPGGRIRYLEDTDGDHRYDKSTLFLDGVNFPNGILAWNRGVLVTAAPEIFYAEDTDGDGRADVRRTLYSGFVEGNQQLRVNGLRLGLDNWIYCASGAHFGGYGEKSRIFSAGTGESIALGSRDFRIRPNQGLLDPQSGPAQFGRDRDDWGNWFGVQNSYPLWHYVLEDHYLLRNPLAAPPDPRRQLAEEANPKVYPVSQLQKRYHNFQQSGRFTSACSPTIYRDELLFPRGAGQHSFTCEPVHNLVHHRVLTDDGVSFTATRPKEESNREFLASSDPWCRPVMARTGPDGALWVVDMYRYMIEHPDFLPPEGQRELKPRYRGGADRGRIYRMVPEKQAARTVPRLAGATIAELVATLENPNGPLRDMAQRLLISKADPAVIEPLMQMAADSKSPPGRLHALCTLDGLGKLTSNLIAAALADPHAGVRRQAVRLAESQPSSATALIEAAAKLADDPDPKVRLQLACTLGTWESPQAADALGRLAVQCDGDRFMTAAVLSSVHRKNVDAVADAVFANQPRPPQPLADQLCGMAIKLGRNAVVDQVIIRRATAPGAEGRFEPWQFTLLARALDVRQMQEAAAAHLDADVKRGLKTALTEARRTTRDPQVSETLRAAAVGLLWRESEHLAADVELARNLLAPQSSMAVQLAVIERLGGRPGADEADVLLAAWPGYTPAIRSAVLAAVSRRPDSIRRLLARLDDGTIRAAELSSATRQALLAASDSGLQKEIEKRLGGPPSDRQTALNQAQPALKLTGDRARGAPLFEKKCSACHQVGNVGRAIGPNLASLTNKTPAGLLEAFIDPSRGVDARYLNYIATLRDGRTFSGLLEVETGSSITLLSAEGQGQTILRSDLEELRSSGKSLMPDGLEQDLTPQDLADLIGFVMAIQ